MFSAESLLLPNGFSWLSLLVRRKGEYAVKTATSELSIRVAAGSLSPAPLLTAPLYRFPELSDAPWMQHLFSVESPLPLLDDFPWLSLPKRWKIWKMFDAVMTSMSGRSRSAAATYLVIVPLAAEDSGSVLPDL